MTPIVSRRALVSAVPLSPWGLLAATFSLDIPVRNGTRFGPQQGRAALIDTARVGGLRVIEPSNLKSYRPILDEAQTRRVVIHQGGATDLVIVRTTELTELDVAHECAMDAAQLLLAADRCGDRRPEVHELGRLAWAADLSDESYEQFVHELVESFASAALRHDWQRHVDLVAAWRSTAEIEANPELMAAILDQGDPSAHRDLRRP